jgi:hypothetical protein
MVAGIGALETLFSFRSVVLSRHGSHYAVEIVPMDDASDFLGYFLLRFKDSKGTREKQEGTVRDESI